MNVWKRAHHAHIVQRIAHGNDKMLLGKLFRHVGIQYEASFDKAIHIGRTLGASKNVVVGTQFDVINKKTFERRPHLVTLWFDRQGNGFLLDTMGEITGKGTVHMAVYKDYPIVREVLGLDTTGAKVFTQGVCLLVACSNNYMLWRKIGDSEPWTTRVSRTSPDITNGAQMLTSPNFLASLLERTFPDA